MAKERKKEILVIDDSYVIRIALTAILTMQGYTVSEAVDGQHALDIISDKMPDCFSAIITDYSMPIMNGQDFVTMCRSPSYPAYNNICIIMSSSSSESELNPTGITYFLQKPCDMDLLLGYIQSSLPSSEEDFDTVETLGVVADAEG